MKKNRESINAGCNEIVEEFLRKETTKSQWMALEKMVADLEKFERSSVKDKNPYTPNQAYAIKSVVNNALEKRTELINANLVYSTKRNKESTLLLSTKVQILLAIMKRSPCHTLKEIDSKTTIIKKAIDNLIKEYADVYEINIAREAKRVEADTDVMQSLKLLITVFRRTIDNLIFSHTLSLENNQEDVQELKTVEEILAEGLKNNDIKPRFYKRVVNHIRSLIQTMQQDIIDQRKEIEELKRSKSELENLVTTDELTQISNRRSFEERYGLEIKRLKRKKTPLFLLLIDIDGFKNINDIYGHKAGDKILKTVAKALKNSIRGIDFIARWGGDEFVLLCPETNLAGVIEVAEKLRDTIETHEFTANFIIKDQKKAVKKRIYITVSLGVAEVIDGQDAEAVFKMADEALYKAKEQGKNRVVLVQKKI